ncbi:MAG: hypothetical protein K2K75_02325 [Muribaculaceae bacterium]|nr:hypothetical protein [Muribaculaceae bacterium]
MIRRTAVAGNFAIPGSFVYRTCEAEISRLILSRFYSRSVPVTESKYRETEDLCCAFLPGAAVAANFVVKKATEDIELRYRFCQASCAFVITKATCRLLRIGAIPSLFRFAKVYPGALEPR